MYIKGYRYLIFCQTSHCKNINVFLPDQADHPDHIYINILIKISFWRFVIQIIYPFLLRYSVARYTLTVIIKCQTDFSNIKVFPRFLNSNTYRLIDNMRCYVV